MLLEVDQIIDYFDVLTKHKAVFDKYNSFPEGEEKEGYYIKYKTHIQKYAYAYRTLNSMNIDLARDDIYRDKQREMQEELNQELELIEILENEMKAYDMAERDAKEILDCIIKNLIKKIVQL